jgi:hypothetical protein
MPAACWKPGKPMRLPRSAFTPSMQRVLRRDAWAPRVSRRSDESQRDRRRFAAVRTATMKPNGSRISATVSGGQTLIREQRRAPRLRVAPWPPSPRMDRAGDLVRVVDAAVNVAIDIDSEASIEAPRVTSEAPKQCQKHRPPAWNAVAIERHRRVEADGRCHWKPACPRRFPAPMSRPRGLLPCSHKHRPVCRRPGRAHLAQDFRSPP